MALEIPPAAEFDAATPDELAEYLAPGLERLEPGWQHPKVFVPLRAIWVTSTVEVVAFEAESEGKRVLLGKRGADPGDMWWVGKFNLPGSVILANEDLEPIELFMSDGRPVDIGQSVVSTDLTSPTDRILGKELSQSVSRVAPVKEVMRYLVKAESGTENKTCVVTEVCLADGHESVVDGAFFDSQEIIDNPPANLVEGHHYFVERGRIALRGAA